MVGRRLPGRAKRLLKAGRKWQRERAEDLRFRWRRSLQLRVVTTTLALSALVIAVLGFFLTQQIADGLLLNKEKSATAQVSQGLTVAESSANLDKKPTSTAIANDFLYPTAQELQDASGNNSSYDVVIEVHVRNGTTYSKGVAGGVDPGSIPAALAASVRGRAGPRGLQQGLLRAHDDRVHRGPRQPAGPGRRRPPGQLLPAVLPVPHDAGAADPAAGPARAGRGRAGPDRAAGPDRLAGHPLGGDPGPARRPGRPAAVGGPLGERMRVRGADDLAALATSFNDMAASLQEKLRELEELSQLQRQFVSDVSHELRTPLTTIKMAADVLLEAKDSFDPAGARSAELLQGQLDRFQSLLEDLLEISRYDANAATLDPDAVDISDIARRAADDAQQLAERRGGRIEFRLPAEPCMADADRRRIERILRNLLVNAVEHGEGHDVIVTVAADRDAVAVAVRDHGVGLKPGQDQLVFDRFWRADPARARTTGGTGLGLAIALEDAQLHGGWLQAWGMPGKGSVFRLTIPRKSGQKLVGSPLPLVPDDTDTITALGEILPGVGRVGGGTAGSVGGGAPGRSAGQRAAPGWARLARTSRRRRTACVAALITVLAVLVTGCVTVPTSGHVQSVNVTQSNGGNSQYYLQTIPVPPGHNWSPEQIVSGFLAANASFANNHAVARQYLTRDASQQWQPGLAVTVYSQIGQAQRLPAEAGQSRQVAGTGTINVEVSGTVLGNLSGSGQYSISSRSKDTGQKFTLVQQKNKQWRISSLPPQVLLTQSDFVHVYQPRNIYFFDPAMQTLVPDPVYVPEEATPAVLVRQLIDDLIPPRAVGLADRRGADRVPEEHQTAQRVPGRRHRGGERGRGAPRARARTPCARCRPSCCGRWPGRATTSRPSSRSSWSWTATRGASARTTRCSRSAPTAATCRRRRPTPASTTSTAAARSGRSPGRPRPVRRRGRRWRARPVPAPSH